MARVAHAMAMENPKITADVVEVQEFPNLAQRYMITGVPKTVINDWVEFVGVVPEAVFVDKVLEAIGVAHEEQGQSIIAVTPELGPSTRPSLKQ